MTVLALASWDSTSALACPFGHLRLCLKFNDSGLRIQGLVQGFSNHNVSMDDKQMAQFDRTGKIGHHERSLFCSGIIAVPHPVSLMVDVRQWLGRGLHVPSVALAMAMTLRFVMYKIPRAMVEWHEHILLELAWRCNYHQWTKSLPWAGIRRLLNKIHGTNCKSSGPLTKGAMRMSWNLAGQLNATVLFCRLRVVDKRHEGHVEAWRT